MQQHTVYCVQYLYINTFPATLQHSGNVLYQYPAVCRLPLTSCAFSRPNFMFMFMFIGEVRTSVRAAAHANSNVSASRRRFTIDDASLDTIHAEMPTSNDDWEVTADANGHAHDMRILMPMSISTPMHTPMHAPNSMPLHIQAGAHTHVLRLKLLSNTA